MSDETAKRLPRRQLFAYSIADTPMSMASMPVALFLPAFYTQDLMAVSFPCFIFLGEGDLWDAAALLFVVGIGGGNFAVVPSSMKADVIDLERLESGEDRAGLFFSAWSTATKMVSALGVGISMPLLDLLGVDPTVTNAPDQVFALQAYFSFVPVAFYALAAYLVVKYPITRSRHHEIREQLAAER